MRSYFQDKVQLCNSVGGETSDQGVTVAGKARVHELAAELGISSKEVLRRLREIGEYVKSASSCLEAPVERRLRECYPGRSGRPRAHVVRHATPPRVPATEPQRDGSAFWARVNDPFDPDYIKPRYTTDLRQYYQGTAPQGLRKFLLDEYLVPQRHQDERPPPTYWTDEVEDADWLVSQWSQALLEGMDVEDILAWIKCQYPVRPQDAIALEQAGVDPSEVGWNYEDRGEPPLAQRLLDRQMTVEEVTLDVEVRRTRV